MICPKCKKENKKNGWICNNLASTCIHCGYVILSKFVHLHIKVEKNKKATSTNQV